ncbi:hypothetical protein AJ80_02634 [Polytolypa hystricis UAMH7299]|uniref:Glycosyl transferase CAP10 domain-containing protein n=1 Tax=Polytolypa hystricis (strain UAMH7299) TaxID=1447883 RepID=A0A2B7YQQ6_POLH7|nr:hypothetical protein AJ80_02634 [Polytolypa hystricis UAMH7299]
MELTNKGNQERSMTASQSSKRPVHSATILLVFAGLSLLAFNRFASIFPRNNDAESHDVSIDLSNDLLYASIGSTQALEKLRKLANKRVWKIWVTIVPAACALALRIEIFRQLLQRTECASSTIPGSLPLLLSIYEYWRTRQSKSGRSFENYESESNRNLLSSIFASTLFLFAAFLFSSLGAGWESTYICSSVEERALQTTALQCFGVLLDAAILAVAADVSRAPIETKDGKRVPTTTTWGCLVLGAAGLWLLVGCIIFILNPEDREWLLSLPASYITSVLKQCLLYTILIISAAKTINQLGAASLSYLLSFSFVGVSQISKLWDSQPLFPAVSVSKALSAILLFHVASYWYYRCNQTTGTDSKKLSASKGWTRLFILTSSCASLCLVFFQQTRVSYHPIDALISYAQNDHTEWAKKASVSQNLKEAVREYERRYKQHPPPGFDIWYEYAVNRSSLIIDDYDQIYEDLLPFWSLAPKELRELTNSMVSNSWNGVSAVIVRNGKAEPQEKILPTHRWMVEGIARMMIPFAQYLPDMDVAFNLNDECRVAVPWEKATASQNLAIHNRNNAKDGKRKTWSENRGPSWPPIRDLKGDSHGTFVDHSFERIFESLARPLCPPSSKVRSSSVWNKRALCLDCVEPHSIDQFLKNWTLASDICHQPDLAFLHGFFLSPASFKVSQVLLPVFSQSKVSGFADILYPSSWNYVDKVKYDPSDDHLDTVYSKKDPTLFWRGTTSEGVSNNGVWQGMTRQRLLHLANNQSLSQVSVLLPSATNPNSYKYTIMDSQAPRTALDIKTSIHIAEEVVRCWGKDCETQTKEFGTVPRSDFQEHWKYRFLFDMDGAAFSGRFIPFLQSHSLPFRTALFRTWIDRRLTPWLHFVPINLRLHDVWSVLAYFSGARTKSADGKTKHVLMQAHDKEGERIAEEGRNWAEKTLRKEDMEIYFFRLLLEWGRLTDDRRAELRFTI